MLAVSKDVCGMVGTIANLGKDSPFIRNINVSVAVKIYTESFGCK
jgi:hypothetical protein